MLKADLHTHSSFSDGRFSPSELVQKAKACGLNTLALTDHDTIEGLPEARQACRRLEISFINGVEISGHFQDSNVHILAYLFDANDTALNCFLVKQAALRRQRAGQIIDRLQYLGVDITLEQVQKTADEKQIITRPDIAKTLKELGIVESVGQAFQRYLSNEGPAFLNFEYPDLEEICSIVKRSGGITVLAHPMGIFEEKHLRGMKAVGLDGIEVIHPAHSFDVQKRYRDLARSVEMVSTGGSDFHGFKLKDHQNFGIVAIDVPLVSKLRAYKKKLWQTKLKVN